MVDRPPEKAGRSHALRDRGRPSNGDGKRRQSAGWREERLRVKRYLRIVPVADTVIAVVVLIGGFLASNIDRMPTGLQGFLEMRLTVQNVLLLLCFTGAWRLICVMLGLYEESRSGDLRAEAVRVIAAVSVGSAVALIFPSISVTQAFSHTVIAYYWVGTIAGMLGFRACLQALLRAPASKTQDVLIVGSGPRAVRLHQELFGRPSNGYRFLGFVDSSEREMTPEVRSRLLGDLSGLEDLLMRQAIDEVIIALPARSRYAEIQRTIEICERGGVPARYLNDVFEHKRTSLEHMLAEPLTAIPAGVSPDDSRLVVKRCVDILLAGVALVVTSPVLAVAALAIKLTGPGPILFSQERYGLNKRRFRMFKLRTMVLDAEAQQGQLEAQNEAKGPVFKIREDPRVTPVGRILRRLSIDELPQLVNVLRGEMSLVGPRPLPMRDVGLFSEPTLMRRFSVYPGVTGLWQVSGRSEVEFDRWIQLDLQYIDEWSLGLDLRILLRTVPTVLQGRGAV